MSVAPTRPAGEVLSTPDGRYIVVEGRLWRKSDPSLDDATRAALVASLMTARRAVREAIQDQDEAAEKRARADVHAAKVALGERGPVWWEDGAPDYGRRAVASSPYAAWYRAVEGRARRGTRARDQKGRP